MTEITLQLNEAALEAIAARAAELVLARLNGLRAASAESSPYLTVEQAATYLGCPVNPKTGKRRQRVDDLLSQGRLTRFKDGSRTLISRAELEAHLGGGA